jgi:hypothetical protein
LKNNPIVLFIAGVIVGGCTMFAILGFLLVQDHSNSQQTIATTDNSHLASRRLTQDARIQVHLPIILNFVL